MKIVIFIAGMIGLGLGIMVFVPVMNDFNAAGGIIKSTPNIAAWDVSMFEMLPIIMPIAMAAAALIGLARQRRP